MSEPVIKISGLTKTFQLGDVEVHALQGVDLEIAQGEFVAIMGASGSGKSTLMNILGCLDRPTGGNYLLEGRDISNTDEDTLASLRSQYIGFVFQNFNLLSRTSALENVELPLLYCGDGRENSERAREALKKLGLEGREASHPSQLSGGQQQRVAIARALINNPTLLLADEPTGNLDSKTASDIMTTLQQLNREQGLTIVLVTHEPDMAAFAKRTVTMRDGRIVSDQCNADISGSQQTSPPPTRPVKNAQQVSLSLIRMALRAAIRAIARNKMRSALTTLGIFIGVAALITMVAVGQGANAAVAAQLAKLGTNLLIVVPGATTTNGVRAGFGSASTLTVGDAEAIQRNSPNVARVGYQIRQLGQLQYGNRNWSTSIQGVSPSYLAIRNWNIVAGRGISDQDEQSAARVCLLGQTVYRNLFGAYQNPIGATILVRNVPLKVIGLLEPRGQSGFGQDQDDTVLIPFTTAERKVIGVAAPSQSQTGSTSIYNTVSNPFGVQPKLLGYVNLIFVQARDPKLVKPAMADITRILRERHRITGDTNDFDVRNISNITQAAQGSSRILAILLASVASISLLVGGIGIMNILLVSVTERTREIGIRMAIGARRIHLLTQFLVEAVLLSVFGGLAGVIAGVLVSELISLIADWPTLLSPAAMVGGFLFSAAVGIFFGFYPARRAARMNPIEALRYE